MPISQAVIPSICFNKNELLFLLALSRAVINLYFHSCAVSGDAEQVARCQQGSQFGMQGAEGKWSCCGLRRMWESWSTSVCVCVCSA